MTNIYISGQVPVCDITFITHQISPGCHDKDINFCMPNQDPGGYAQAPSHT